MPGDDVLQEVPARVAILRNEPPSDLTLVALVNTLSVAGHEDEAVAAYREVLADKGVAGSDRRTAEQAIQVLKKELQQ